MSKWKRKTLGEFLSLQRGYDLTSDEREAGNIPVMGAAGQNGFHNKALAYAPGIIVGRSGGSFGQIHLVMKDFWPHNTAMFVTDFKGNEPYFAYYFLKNLNFSQFNSGSAQPSLNRNFIYPISISVPAPEEQKRIASILLALDAKIELNSCINADLEAMAKTLYDYWFVQFDFPFDFAQGKLDANGKPYKTSGGKMVYNTILKREIPKGWNAFDLGSIAELYQPKTISEKEMISNGKYLVYGANGIVGRFDSYNHEHSVIAITCRGNSCGEINITRPFSWITGNAMVVNPINECMSIDYLFNTLKRSGLEKVITGSAQPQITRTNLSPLKIISPPDQLVEAYSKKVLPGFIKRLAILDEIETLQKLRDWLLPMLMNGQVTVQQ